MFALSTAVICFLNAAFASNLDTIGANLLQAVTTNLNGTGIRVAQPEAWDSQTAPGTNTWEVAPSVVGRPLSIFTYASTKGVSAAYPNSLGNESHHAEEVGSLFYGVPGGVATNVAHVDNSDADYFYNVIIAAATITNINDSVVNQSFIFGSLPVATQQAIDSNYDDYAARFKVLFVSGPGNSGIISPPATCYNGIAVAAYGGNSSIGPTPDNGRSKPDISAPADYTSFSTPQAAGAAAVLMQAGLRGDGGSSTSSAADIRTVKALLLNGAVKPADWTNGIFTPLDARYGAGVLNVFNSYKQLAGGLHAPIISTNVVSGNPHPPLAASGNINVLSGWDSRTISSSTSLDGVNHYYFEATNGPGFTATVTLAWNRQQGQASINDLDLFLYDAKSGVLIASSTSRVDNVEHLFVRNLPPGRYDLQVLKNGGSLGSKRITNNETYALAFEFFNLSLGIAYSGNNITLTWPIYPAGFVLESTTNLSNPSLWTTNNPPPAIVNGMNQAVISAPAGNQFFRLRR